MKKYWTDPGLEKGGNTQVAEFDGWTCDGPTAAMGHELGVASERQSDSAWIVVRPTQTRVFDGPQANALKYSKDSQPGTYYFTSPDGGFECKIDKGEERASVSCEGDLPANAPDHVVIDGRGTVPVNTIEVVDGRPAKFVNYGDRTDHNYAGSQPVLPYDSVLYAAGVNCVITRADGVRCAIGQHGFTISTHDFTLN